MEPNKAMPKYPSIISNKRDEINNLNELASNLQLKNKNQIEDILEKITKWHQKVKSISDINKINMLSRQNILKHSCELLIKKTYDALKSKLDKIVWQMLFYDIISIFLDNIRLADNLERKEQISLDLLKFLNKSIVYYKYIILECMYEYSELKKPQKCLLAELYLNIGDLYRYFHSNATENQELDHLKTSKIFYQLSFHSNPKMTQALLNNGLIGYQKKNALDTLFFNLLAISQRKDVNNINESIVQLTSLLKTKFMNYTKKLDSHYHFTTNNSGEKCLISFPRNKISLKYKNHNFTTHHIMTHDEIMTNLNLLFSLVSCLKFTDGYFDYIDILVSETVKISEIYFSDLFDCAMYSHTITAQIFCIFSIILQLKKSNKSYNQTSSIDLLPIFCCYFQLFTLKYIRSAMNSYSTVHSISPNAFIYSLTQALYIFWTILEFVDETITYCIRECLDRLIKCQYIKKMTKISNNLISINKSDKFSEKINHKCAIDSLLISLGISELYINKPLQLYVPKKYYQILTKLQLQNLAMLHIISDLLKKLNNNQMFVKKDVNIDMISFLKSCGDESSTKQKNVTHKYQITKILFDTNIWISHTDEIIFLLRNFDIIIYIPKIVLEELKNLSKIEDPSKKDVAEKSIDCLLKLNEILKNDPNTASNLQVIQIESPTNSSNDKSNFNSTTNDDIILECCKSLIKISKVDEICILVTNDYNLQNKAKLIDVFGFNFNFLSENFQIF